MPAAATDDMTLALVAHIQALKQRPALARAVFVIIIESNFGRVAEDTRRAMTRLAGTHQYVVMAQDPKRHRNGTQVMRAGFRTDHRSKERSAIALNDLLMRQAVRFHQEFTVARPLTAEMGPRERIIMELRHYKREMRPPKDRFGDWRPFYIGIANDGGHMTTDCVMSISFVIENVDIFLTAPEYATFRRPGNAPGL